MDRSILNYALVKAHFDEGTNYYEAFSPFVLQVMSTEIYDEIRKIQKFLKDRFELFIPIHVLDMILDKMHKNGHIDRTRRGKKYILLDQGKHLIDKFETEREVERRINAVLSKLIEFFTINNKVISLETAQKLLLTFIKKNLY